MAKFNIFYAPQSIFYKKLAQYSFIQYLTCSLFVQFYCTVLSSSIFKLLQSMPICLLPEILYKQIFTPNCIQIQQISTFLIFIIRIVQYMASVIIMSQNRAQGIQRVQSKSQYQYIQSEMRKYKKIDYVQRMKAIKLIKEDRLSYRKVGNILGLSPSTIKMIVSRYQKTGAVFESKRQRKIREQNTDNFVDEQKNQNNNGVQIKQNYEQQANACLCYYGIVQIPPCYFYLI